MGPWETHFGEDGRNVDSEVAARDQEVTSLQVTMGNLQTKVADLTAELAKYQPVPVPDPVPDPTSSMWVGTSLYTPGGETMQAGFDRRTSEWGAEPEMVRYFFSGMPAGWPTFGSAATVVSFKPPNNDVLGFAGGKYDQQINAWLNSLPRDGKARRVAIYHEREDNIEAAQFSFANARGMDAKMHALIAAANGRNGTNIKFGLILMGWTVDSRSGRKVSNYLPTDWKYDWMGWDAYAGNSLSMDLPDLTYTKENFGACADATKAHGAKNWYICETGTSNKGHTADEYDTMQAQWLKGAFSIARGLGCRGFMYWDSVTGTGAANDYQIKGTKARAAMGAGIKAD